jgi:hypothetical protein
MFVYSFSGERRIRSRQEREGRRIFGKRNFPLELSGRSTGDLPDSPDFSPEGREQFSCRKGLRKRCLIRHEIGAKEKFVQHRALGVFAAAGRKSARESGKDEAQEEKA